MQGHHRFGAGNGPQFGTTFAQTLRSVIKMSSARFVWIAYGEYHTAWLLLQPIGHCVIVRTGVFEHIFIYLRSY